LPKRVGPLKALELTEKAQPIGTKKAKSLGYIDEILADDYETYLMQVRERAKALAHSQDYQLLLEEKQRIRVQDEKIKPLAAYRAAELKQMKINFSGTCAKGEINYHKARYNFVHKIRPTITSPCLANYKQQEAIKVNELRVSWAT
jgi:putative two-component system hydrogenase maturation factor HypX/HoxX